MPAKRAFYLRHQVTPYVILFIERDGSTYLSGLLMSHPEIHALYERFAELKQQGVSAKEQLTWADQFLSPPLVGRHAAFGFKTKLVDVLDLAGFTELLKQKKCHIIYMQRRNRVKAVISRINAKRLHEKSGYWNLYKEADRVPPTAFDLDEFDRYLKEREDADQELGSYINQIQLPTLKLVYEDLMVAKDTVLQQVFSFLKVQPCPVQGKSLKHTSDNLRDVILNFDELRAHYRETPYAEMFDEVLVQPSAR